jgi:hypothetical protein
MIFKYYFSLTRSREPEPKLQYTGSGQKFRLLAAPAPQHCIIDQFVHNDCVKIDSTQCYGSGTVRIRIIFLESDPFLSVSDLVLLYSNDHKKLAQKI